MEKVVDVVLRLFLIIAALFASFISTWELNHLCTLFNNSKGLFRYFLIERILDKKIGFYETYFWICISKLIIQFLILRCRIFRVNNIVLKKDFTTNEELLHALSINSKLLAMNGFREDIAIILVFILGMNYLKIIPRH